MKEGRMELLEAEVAVGDVAALRARWAALVKEEPTLRIRNAAERLGVSEAALLQTRLGEGVARLEVGWGEFLGAMPSLGRVMALTRNDAAVHERQGVFRDVSVDGQMGLVVGPEIDLRLFLGRWAVAFSVEEAARGQVRRSFQVFDAHGEAIHKVYMGEHSDEAQFARLATAWRAKAQAPIEAFKPAGPSAAERPDAEVDVEGFREAWRGLQDTHDFFGVLRRFGVSRTQAMRLAPEGFARPLEVTVGREALQGAAAQGLSVMIFVGNPGAIQIHTGKVERLVTTGPWFNVLDPDFNLHLREDLIASAWWVRKPTVDGDVTSVELFDAQGGTILMMFGERKPGRPEEPRWRALAQGLRGREG
jgi:putative hemin transport protein